MGTQTTHLLGDQQTCHLGRKSRTGRVVLDCVEVNQFGSNPVGQHKSISRRAVVISGRVLLHVQPTQPSRGDDRCFGPHNVVALGLKVDQHCAGDSSLFIAEQFNRR